MSREPTISRRGLSVQADGQRDVVRSLPEETPVAMVFDGGTLAVMMASPVDLEDFAIGFALSEGVIDSADQVDQLELVTQPNGIEARFWLNADVGAALRARRRSMAGPVGCGLCGIDSLDQAVRDLPRVQSTLRLDQGDVAHATDALRAFQPLHDRTHAVHAAGFLQPGNDKNGGIVLAREDVGRHNALDKLIGAMARQQIDPATGAFVITSRVSIDMVQKTVLAGCPVLVAVSAPTGHAVRMADQAGLTVAAFARAGGFDLYTHPDRIQIGASDVA